jgi:predicted nucleic acid-binding protein
MGFLIDTCIWVDVERGKISPQDVSYYTGKEPVFISPVSIAELTYGAEITKDESIRQKRTAVLNRLKKKPVLIIDETTGDIFGRLSAALIRHGRGAQFRVQDIWLASQAIQHGYKFLTRNKKDFVDIQGLDLVIFGEEIAKG